MIKESQANQNVNLQKRNQGISMCKITDDKTLEVLKLSPAQAFAIYEEDAESVQIKYHGNPIRISRNHCTIHRVNPESHEMVMQLVSEASIKKSLHESDLEKEIMNKVFFKLTKGRGFNNIARCASRFMVDGLLNRMTVLFDNIDGDPIMSSPPNALFRFSKESNVAFMGFVLDQPEIASGDYDDILFFLEEVCHIQPLSLFMSIQGDFSISTGKDMKPEALSIGIK